MDSLILRNKISSLIIIHYQIFENVQVLFHHFLNLLGESKSVKSVSVLLFSLKLMNAIQKSPHIVQSYPCIQ